MKKRLIPAALCALAAACTSSGALYESGNPPAVRMAASEIVHNPSPTNLDGIVLDADVHIGDVEIVTRGEPIRRRHADRRAQQRHYRI